MLIMKCLDCSLRIWVRLIKLESYLISYTFILHRFPMPHSSREVVVKPRTKKLFEKLKSIAKIFESIEDIEDFVTKVQKHKRVDEIGSNDSNSNSNRSQSEHVIQRRPAKWKRRRKNESASSSSSKTPTPPPIKIKHSLKKHETKKRRKTHKHGSTVVESSSENSSSDSDETSPSSTSTDDNIVHQELTKIIWFQSQQFKPLDYRFSASRIEKDPPKQEGHNDEDAAEAVILRAATTRSVVMVAEAAVEVPETWNKLRKPTLQTFRLAWQTTTHAQAARESLVLNERGKYLKAATPSPGVIQDSVLKNLKRRSESAQNSFNGVRAKLDSPVAQIENKEVIQRVQPQSSKIEAKSEEIGGRLMKI
ncbi:MAG: hypothetical protein EZS28_034053 [Streblomastix strix]|uniref:Uncharacterized protein n=1 Tax=Streblomastix strix TaxID=222440 RepID=A0A5J4UIL3_9EUKA|nr:MAG: hypothetical protein EZS28_034053 [Streblomastix strix]